MPDKPLPTTEGEWNLLIQTLNTKLPGFAGVLGTPAADTDFLANQAPNFSYLVTIAPQVSDAKEAFTSYKNAAFDGDPNAVPATAPTFPKITPPNAIASGIIPMVKAIIKRIKSSAGYNDTIGEELGLVDSGAPSLSPDLLTAELKLTAKSGSRVEIAFSKQGQDAMRVEFKRKNDTSFQLAGVYLSSPGTHDAPSVPPEDPESRQYRGILLKKNDPVGNYSPDYTVVTTP